MPSVNLSDEDIQNILVAIQVSWQTGSVKDEAGGAALSALRVKLQNARLVKLPEAKKEPDLEKKKG